MDCAIRLCDSPAEWALTFPGVEPETYVYCDVHRRREVLRHRLAGLPAPTVEAVRS